MSNYQEVLARVREWVPAQTSKPFDIWAPRWELADNVPGSMLNGSLTDNYDAQVLRAVNALVDEGVLVKVNSGRDARYMLPEVRERRMAEAEEAGKRHADRVLRYTSVRNALAKAGFLTTSNSQLDVRLELEDWERLVSTYLDDGGS